MKKNPVTIKKLDVQPISDEDLKALTDVRGAAALSDIWFCDCNSTVIYCWDSEA